LRPSTGNSSNFPESFSTTPSPAEDAVDEAESGFEKRPGRPGVGSDLNTLGTKGQSRQKNLEQVAAASKM